MTLEPGGAELSSTSKRFIPGLRGAVIAGKDVLAQLRGSEQEKAVSAWERRWFDFNSELDKLPGVKAKSNMTVEDYRAWIGDSFRSHIGEFKQVEGRRVLSGFEGPLEPYERLDYLLFHGNVDGGNYSDADQAALRRIIVAYARATVGQMGLPQQEVVRKSILSNEEQIKKIGDVYGQEQLALDWLKNLPVLSPSERVTRVW